MFEIGKNYVITLLEDDFGVERSSWATYVIDHIDGALITARGDSRTLIINTQSPRFVSAELVVEE